ncbi:uncharacterized protein LOC123213579 [Mangifera indica]|uniref:uncharacterized protein LOC123213579 n=1 Tax=Mangifera indica TaxID=29780 RepID=UPI001CFB6598|nr:uncharacterized protein LOC123213579 [Mangifera indica]
MKKKWRSKVIGDCPTELREAIASIIFAAPRCSDLPDLLQIKNLFTSKYRKEYVAAIAELRPDTSVNRTVNWLLIIEKLSVSAPSPEARLSVLKEIAGEYNVVWDSFQTEAALNKKHEDLLPSSPRSSTSNGAHPILPSESRLGSQHLQVPSPTNEIEQSAKSSNAVLVSDTKRETTLQSSDVLERARAAIASAERAAAQLVNAEFGLLKLEGKSS